ncbi:flagellar hook-associated protein FlgK [Modestobacter sp. I12A-02628]|uniref:Flagellar hook-associated protein 1 n=1 Tax=Goekera deserti TaxID=2497753 RepID=A0A7K3WCW3_9ACTN|nr:flagellar hook-associated protein FlgK [Goekera deserti]NDI49002.1 flagellar hook-associated protein FlgK [Goekera deserti]NEL54207.1 flagellar hook-associated protein FlgK [Goekera deserti]
MGSNGGSFGGLSRALTALHAQQRGLDVTGQNIANVNTVGYSRQRAELQSIGGSVVPAIFAKSPIVGQGVSADQVTRIRDAFLESRAQNEGATAARLTEQSASLTEIESAFREPGSTGVQALLSKVWQAFGNVSNHPENIGARTALLESAKTLVGGLQTTRSSLDRQWGETRANLQTLVADANTMAGQVADLNKAILAATNAGMESNELADKRDVLVQELAASVGATSSRADDGSLTISVGGSVLVSKSSAFRLAVDGATSPDTVTAATAPRVLIVPGGSAVPLGGRAAAQVDALGPAAAQGTSILTFRGQLDTFAQDLATTVNTVHSAGYDLDGTSGNVLFASSGGPLTAGSISLGITDPRGVAAAKYAPAGVPLKASNDGHIADALTKLGQLPSGPDATYRSLIVSLGVQSSVAASNVTIQNVIVGQVDSARESVAGVNLDEEMTNMLQYQHAYSAAGRLVTAIDEMLDTVINRMGLVGR